jgi:valyl-tRNA synthetase
MLVIQDIMVRYQRMLGKKTLWIPGTDHAAIATQSKVEKLLEKEGLKKHDLGREAFLKRVEQFAQESHDTIVHQTKKMGASLDWSREAYTLDDKRNLAVRTAFKKMYDDGLIYRKYRVVNWDPKGQTVISDDEIVYEERDAVLYTFKYWNDFPISISTTRPETKIGDAAVAVHPDDVRYQQYIGQTFTGTFCGVDLSIKIIADRSVEQEFGTGALGVTPAHSKIDWDMAQKNNLPVETIINEYARMTIGGDLLLGKKTSEAREIVAQWLRDNNLMESEATIKQNVSTAERTGAIIEPLPKLQWFIDVNKPMHHVTTNPSRNSCRKQSPSTDSPSFLIVLKRPISIGLIIYKTGVFRAKFGSDIASLFGIKEKKSIVMSPHLKAMVGPKTRTTSILGFHQDFGHSQPLDGLNKPLTLQPIIRHQYLKQDMTSYRFG